MSPGTAAGVPEYGDEADVVGAATGVDRGTTFESRDTGPGGELKNVAGLSTT
jgi:hypothetical protein